MLENPSAIHYQASMKASRFPILLLLAGGLATGPNCQGVEDQKADSPAPKQGASAVAGHSSSAPAPRPGKLIFEDDFSNPASGWERNRDEDYTADYLAGEYQIKNALDSQVTQGMFEGRQTVDGDFSVTVRKISGPDDIRCGLVTRYTGTGKDFLEASVLPDGRCSLWVRHYEQQKLKTRPDFKPCQAVRRGNEPNQLRLVVSGNRATLYVNGEKVAEADNVSREGGGFGLFASSTSTASDVRFDDFKLHATP